MGIDRLDRTVRKLRERLIQVGDHVHAGHFNPVESVVAFPRAAADPEAEPDGPPGRQVVAALRVDDPPRRILPPWARSIARMYCVASRCFGMGSEKSRTCSACWK